MTLNQLNSFTNEEVGLILYVVNVISPPATPKMEFQPRHLTWFRHDALIKKLVDSFTKLKPEGHATYTSLMEKLGVKIEIKKVEPPSPPTSSETSSEIPLPVTESVAVTPDTPKTGSSETTGSV